MKIALDAAAGDQGPAPNIEGAIQAANEWGVEIVLVGPASEIQSQLASRGIASNDKRFEVIDSHEVIGMGEEPVAACRARPRSSIMICAELVASGKAAALVSAGNSGATMVACLWHLKRLPGVLRPAIATAIPNTKDGTLLIDTGANADCKPWHLLQFGLMGSIYAQDLFKKKEAAVGILSLGEEEGKGNEVVKEAIPLLRSSGLNFYGPVEGRDIPLGTVDVIVCDGFVGNVALKTVEATASAVFTLLKSEIMSGSFLNRLGGQFLKGALGRIKRKMSYDEYGGAPLLGVNGAAIICHGSSNAKAITNALGLAKRFVESGVNEKIKTSLQQMKSTLETEKVRS